MINGPRRSRIDWNPTEIEASKVGKTRKTPGFPGHRFLCPISHEPMVDPVIASDGVTYERACIEAWLVRAPGVTVAAASRKKERTARARAS